jgi:hypothetical protein
VAVRARATIAFVLASLACALGASTAGSDVVEREIDVRVGLPSQAATVLAHC